MRKLYADPVIKFFISTLGMIAIFLVLKELQHIFIPFVLAYFLFFMFQPVNKFLKSKKIPSGISIVLDLVIVVLFIWGLSSIVIASFNKLDKAIPEYEAKLNNIIASTIHSLGITNTDFANFNLLEFV